MKIRKFINLILILLIIASISLIQFSAYPSKNNNNYQDYKNNDKDSISLPQSSSIFNDFSYYKIITIDHNNVYGSEDLIDFPILISIIDSDLHDHAQEDGDDIAFSNGTTWLEHEIELYNPTYSSTHAQLVVWVRTPILYAESQNTQIYMYYGNDTMESQQNPSEVWSSNYKAVWHLNTNLLDATANNNDGTNSGADDVSAFIGNGRDYNGAETNGDYSNMGSGDSIDNVFNGGGTISAWIYPEGWGGGDYGRVLAKSSVTDGTDGWVLCVDGALAEPEQLIFYRGIYKSSPPKADTRGLWYTGGYTIDPDQWNHVVVTYDDSVCDNDPIIYINGVSQSLTMEPAPPDTGYAVDDSSQSAYIGNYGGAAKDRTFDGVIDEVRILSGIRSSDWIKTEYDNQNDPDSFYSIGIAQKVDPNPPTYANLEESAPILELGDTENITIDVFDLSGIKQVLIEINELNNYSMEFIGGNTWRNNSWIPTFTGQHNYTIYMEDNRNNWNSTSGSIQVIDTTLPFWFYLEESAPTLELGDTEIITIDVFDQSGIKQVLFEINELNNYSMEFIGGNTWRNNSWVPTFTGQHNYTIYMEDTNNNWNFTSGDILVEDTTPPLWSDLVYTHPLELGSSETITIDVFDFSDLSQVLFEIGGKNYTMINIGGDTWQNDTWTPLSVGDYDYTVYINDTHGNWNTTSGSIQVVDTTAPSWSNLDYTDPLEKGIAETITIDIIDLSGVSEVIFEIENKNYTMVNIGGDTWQNDTWIPLSTGKYGFTIYMNDTHDNWNMTSGEISVIIITDITPPTWSNLDDINPLELGAAELISIDVFDDYGILEVKFEIEGHNYTMFNISTNTWQYNTWIPSFTGDYDYTIHIRDIGDNWNSTDGTIQVRDTILPYYDGPIASADVLTLGNTENITITITDIAGINLVLIEIGGVNYSMRTIDGTDIWCNDSWTPTTTGKHFYTIYMEDKNGNWNSVTESIYVISDTPPPLDGGSGGGDGGGSSSSSSESDFLPLILVIVGGALGALVGIIIFIKKRSSEPRDKELETIESIID